MPVAPPMAPRETDHLIIGSGIAGLMLAIKLSRLGRVTLIAKGQLMDSNTWYAQGGIASVLSPSDSFAEHCQDTMIAGAGLCHADIVKLVIEGGPAAIAELIQLGVDFTRWQQEDNVSGDAPYHLTREGGHSQRRVIHADDMTGREVLRGLVEVARRLPSLTIYENQQAIDLITSDKYQPSFTANYCLGAYVLERKTGEIYSIQAQRTYLCTGGHGKIYLYTSNPDSATGDGLAMGWRAGCKVANLEFMQFHPTCLFHPKIRTFLISEAVRGEGAVLRDEKGHDFMPDFHPLGALAPRDIVARAIDHVLKKSGAPHVFLDATSIGREKVQRHFPNIYATCQEIGLDLATDMIPVVPAAHYSCGGLAVDSWGRTNVQNLYAIGEVACTGLHGANRLASNSLLEALVFAERVAQHVEREAAPHFPSLGVPAWDSSSAAPPDELVVLSHTWDEIRRMMWHYVGIERTDKRLARALTRIEAIRHELNTYYWDYQVTAALIEVRNLADVAYLTIRCAMSRKESRGINFNLDYPHTAQQAKDTVIW